MATVVKDRGTWGGARAGAGRRTFFPNKKQSRQFSVLMTAEGHELLDRLRAQIEPKASRSDFLASLLLLHPEFSEVQVFSQKEVRPIALLFPKRAQRVLAEIVRRTGQSRADVLESLLHAKGRSLTRQQIESVAA